jgi:CRP-like cAMP-binding protein
LVASFGSLLTGYPSNEFIECIVPGQLVKYTYVPWAELYTQHAGLNTFGRIMAQNSYLMGLDRIAQLQYQQASQRYEAFLKMYPQLLNLIPHHYIASYIGVTPESLSRIRKNTMSA